MKQGKAGDVVRLKDRESGFTDPVTAFDLSRDQEKKLTDPIGERTQAAIGAGGLIIVGAEDTAPESAEEFIPLSREETQKRIEDGDESTVVLKSIAHHIRQSKADFDDQQKIDEPEKTGLETRLASVNKVLPDDLPAREIFERDGLALEVIKTLDRERLIAIKDIGPKTADEVLAYFAGQK